MTTDELARAWRRKGVGASEIAAATDDREWHASPDPPMFDFRMFEIRRCPFCLGLGGHRFSCAASGTYDVRRLVGRVEVTATGTKKVST